MTRALLVLSVLLTLVAVALPQEGRRSSKSRPKKVRQLKSNLESVRAKKNRLRAELTRTRRQTKVVVGDIHEVDARLDRIQDQLEQTSTRLALGRRQQKVLASELGDASVKLEQTRRQLRVRLRRIYMEGDGSVLAVLVGSDSVGDLVSRQDLMESIARQDRLLFDRYRTLLDAVATRKQRQDQLVREVDGLARDQKRQEGALADVKREKRIVLYNLQVKQVELRKLIRQYEADENSITSEIAAYSRRIQTATGRKFRLPNFTGRFGRPVNAPMTSGFGRRFHPILRYVRLHAGVDFGARIGTPIMAAANGRVVSTGYGRGFGNRVIIDHGGGIMTVYAHCSAIYCSPGQMVRRGQRIAAVGNSGLSTGPHLHFEMRVNGRPVNPLGRM